MKQNLKNILSPVLHDIEKVNDRLGELIRTGVPLIDDSSMHLFQGGGKNIRSSLVLLASGLKGGMPENVTDLAAAVEIIHGASLIHDDIIDKSFMRRGVASVHAEFGEKVAVLAGDYLYSLAMDIAANCGDQNILLSITNASNKLVMGELSQIEYSNIEKISLENYFDIIDKKTGRLMATSVEIGAIRGGCSPEETSNLYELGLHMGYAFQIVDDLIDFSDSSDVSGKDVGNDYMDGKVTLPLIYILENGTDDDRAELEELLEDRDMDKWIRLKELVNSTGAVDYTRDRAVEFTTRAASVLDNFTESVYKSVLKDLIDFIVNRKY